MYKEVEGGEAWMAEDEKTTITRKVEISNLSIQVLDKAWDKMYGWCRAADCEVSGLGLVRNEGGNFLVYDAFLLEQESSAASTDLKEEAVAKLMEQLHKKKIPLKDMRFWWHTHHDFGVFWSGTDTDTIDKLAGASADWYLSTVINQKGEYKCRLDLRKPCALALDDLIINVQRPVDRALVARCKAEVARKVTKPAPVSTFSGKYYNGSYYGYGGYGGYHPEVWRDISSDDGPVDKADTSKVGGARPLESKEDDSAGSSYVPVVHDDDSPGELLTISEWRKRLAEKAEKAKKEGK